LKTLAGIKKMTTFATRFKTKRVSQTSDEKQKGLRKEEKKKNFKIIFPKACQERKVDYLCTPLNNGKH
jgi:hypothetical protein